jgi:hypothetical protein
MKDFFAVYRLYRKHHGPRYSAWIAYQIAVIGAAF